MKELETLLENYWIVKEDNKERYYHIKDAIPKMKHFIEEKLGYQLIVNPYLIKLEKLPGQPEGWMGIQSFQNPLEYAILCLLLMYLEDKGAEEQFVLSQVTEFLQGVYPAEPKLDWTLFQHRRSLIKVLRFAEELKLIRVNDGDENQFMSQQDTEVLYENTGISRYFMRHFAGNILNYESLKDMETDEWLEMDQDRGRVRRNRVYRRLMMSPVVYQQGVEDADYLYIKNQRSMLQNDFEKLFHATLHVHKNTALLMMEENKNYKDTFPSSRGISDIVLFVNRGILEEIESGGFLRKENDTIALSIPFFKDFLEKVRKKYQDGWSKTYREMSTDKLYHEVVGYMEGFQMVALEENTNTIILMPLVGKLVGDYPKDFLETISKKEDETNEQ